VIFTYVDDLLQWLKKRVSALRHAHPHPQGDVPPQPASRES
jgi:hypothetical protein